MLDPGRRPVLRQRIVQARGTHPLGRPRSIGLAIVLFVVTLGFYGWYWAYKTHEELKQHTGDGAGGVLGLVIWILVGFISAFLIPSEIGKMYARGGETPPVNGWAGLWLVAVGVFLIRGIVWFVKVQGALNRHWEGHGR